MALAGSSPKMERRSVGLKAFAGMAMPVFLDCIFAQMAPSVGHEHEVSESLSEPLTLQLRESFC